MKVIYIDILFLVNFIINTSILLCEGFLLKLPKKTLRIVVGAAIGALYSCLVFTLDFDALSSVWIKAACALLINFASFGICSVRAAAKRALVFMALTVVLGVSMLFFLYFTKLGIRLGGVVRSGIYYLDIPAHYLISCSVTAYFVLHILEKIFKKQTERSLCVIKISRFGKSVELTALVDTGNMLTDPLSGKKVIIAEASKLSPLFGYDVVDLLSPGFDLDMLPEGFRIIPFSSIGKKDGLLAAFVPDEVEVDYCKKDNMIAAIFDGNLSKSGDYNALIGPV